jgi:hypothetical protein
MGEQKILRPTTGLHNILGQRQRLHSRFCPERQRVAKLVRTQGCSDRAPIKAGILRVVSEDANHWLVSFLPASSGTSNYEVHAALLVSGMSSEVKHGENAGRHLLHDFAAQTLTTQALTLQSGGLQSAFIIDTKQNRTEGRLALAFWATRSGHLEPIQAVGGWLP